MLTHYLCILVFKSEWPITKDIGFPLKTASIYQEQVSSEKHPIKTTNKNELNVLDEYN